MGFKVTPFRVTYAGHVSDKRQAMAFLLDLDFITAEAGEGHTGRHHTSSLYFCAFAIFHNRRWEKKI